MARALHFETPDALRFNQSGGDPLKGEFNSYRLPDRAAVESAASGVWTKVTRYATDPQNYQNDLAQLARKYKGRGGTTEEKSELNSITAARDLAKALPLIDPTDIINSPRLGDPNEYTSEGPAFNHNGEAVKVQHNNSSGVGSQEYQVAPTAAGGHVISIKGGAIHQIEVLSKIARQNDLSSGNPTEILGITDEGQIVTRQPLLEDTDINPDNWYAQNKGSVTYDSKLPTQAAPGNNIIDEGTHQQPILKGQSGNSYVGMDVRAANLGTDKTGTHKLFDSALQPILPEDVAQNPDLAPHAPKNPGAIRWSPDIAATVQTPKFQSWFRGSKVVDESGQPRVLFHTTSAPEFDAFRRRLGDVGIHFGTEGQAQDRMDFLASRGRPTEGARTVPVFLNIKNPLRLPDMGAWDADNLSYGLRKSLPDEQSQQQILAALRSSRAPNSQLAALRDLIEAKGYDGVVYKNTGETAGAAKLDAEHRQAWDALIDAQKRRGRPTNGFDAEDTKTPEYIKMFELSERRQRFREENAEDSYIAFRPSQIKNALTNSGDYSPSKGNMSLSPDAPQRRGPRITMPANSPKRNINRPMRPSWRAPVGASKQPQE